MPSAALKSVAKKAHKPHDVAEHDWDHAKKIVKKEYGYSEDNPRFWALVMGITKRMLGLKKESITFKQFLEDFKKPKQEEPNLLPAPLKKQAGPILSKYEKKQIKKKIASGKPPMFLKKQAD